MTKQNYESARIKSIYWLTTDLDKRVTREIYIASRFISFQLFLLGAKQKNILPHILTFYITV